MAAAAVCRRTGPPRALPTRTEAEPRFYTPRDLSRKTLGRKVGRILEVIDGPPMPWQQFVLDVACEIDPVTGLFFYREVVVVVLRQAGKTSMSRAKVTHRCITTDRARVLYTAQDRNKSLQRLEHSFYNPLMGSPLAPYLGRPRWANGSELVRWRNGSSIFIDAPTKKTSVHGDTLPEAHIDEAFAHSDARIEQAVSPTMVTVRGAQKWITSAAGDSSSTFLWGKVEAGRARCLSGAHGRIAYFEYSAPPDADRDDPKTWLATHPAIGYTIDLDTMQAEHDGMDATEFDRAYLGWWPTAKAKPWVIPKDSWRACSSTDDGWEWTSEPIWSVDVSPERDWGSIGMAVGHPEARCWIEAPAHEEGVQWIVPRLTKLAGELGGRLVALDGSGPAAALIPDLEDAGFEVLRLNRQRVVDACGALYDDVLAVNIRHDGDPDVEDALKSAATRASGDAWLWVRGRSLDDITTLYAVTLARYAFVATSPADYDIADSL